MAPRARLEEVSRPNPGRLHPQARRERRAILAEVRKLRHSAAANGCHVAAEWLDAAIKILMERDAPRRKKEKQEALELHVMEFPKPEQQIIEGVDLISFGRD